MRASVSIAVLIALFFGAMLLMPEPAQAQDVSGVKVRRMKLESTNGSAAAANLLIIFSTDFGASYQFKLEAQGLPCFRISFGFPAFQIQSRKFYALYVTAAGVTRRLNSFNSGCAGFSSFGLGGTYSTTIFLGRTLGDEVFPGLDFNNDVMSAQVAVEIDDGNDACDLFTGCPPAVVVLSGSTN